MMMDAVRKLIDSGKTVTISLKGNSMNPYIVHLRDSMTLRKATDADVRKGTVALVLTDDGHYVLHRIYAVDGDVITMLGDGNVKMTEKCTRANIIGVMQSLDRKGHTVTPESREWKLYSRLWNFLTPVRRYPLALWRRLHRKLIFHP